MAGEANQLVKKQLQVKKVKRDVDVKEIFLSESDLSQIPDMGRFTNLQFLWLNNNKLQIVDCLSQNFRLSELYLQFNSLKSLAGALSHLSCLRVLLLHNNQLEKLDRVVHELRHMHTLNTLNLFNNPVSQEPEYRVYVVHHVPSLQLLDRHEVMKLERDVGRRLYDQPQDSIKETVAFGRRSQGPPSIYYPADTETTPPARPDYEVGNNFYRDNPPFPDNEQAVSNRFLRCAVMEYTHFDWSKVPRADERRLSGKSFHSPQMITTRFR